MISTQQNHVVRHLMVACAALAFVLPTFAQQGPTISGADEECIPRVRFPILDVDIQPPTVQVARLYFRAAHYPDFYWVRLQPAPTGGFQAILPQPAAETQRIVFYAEAIDSTFAVTRTPEMVADVVDSEAQCDEAPQVYRGTDPDIVVGSTVPGSAAYPPGFATDGIVGTVAGGIAATGSTDGVPVWVWPVAILGGIGGGAILVDQIDDDDDPSQPPVSPFQPQ